jgi:hypothetical protein
MPPRPRLALALAAVVTAATAAAPRAAAARLAQPITLVWVDPGEMASFAAEDAMTEALAMLREAGASARWRHAEVPNLLGEDELAVVLVAAPGANSGLVMGSAPLTDAAPAIWVHPDAVAKVVGLGARGTGDWTPGERRGFARALGRVAAHEVVHAILGSPQHASTGLMSRALQRNALLGPMLQVDVRTRRAVGQALAAPLRWTLRSAPLQGTRAPEAPRRGSAPASAPGGSGT